MGDKEKKESTVDLDKVPRWSEMKGPFGSMFGECMGPAETAVARVADDRHCDRDGLLVCPEEEEKERLLSIANTAAWIL